MTPPHGSTTVVPPEEGPTVRTCGQKNTGMGCFKKVKRKESIRDHQTIRRLKSDCHMTDRENHRVTLLPFLVRSQFSLEPPDSLGPTVGVSTTRVVNTFAMPCPFSRFTGAPRFTGWNSSDGCRLKYTDEKGAKFRFAQRERSVIRIISWDEKQESIFAIPCLFWRFTWATRLTGFYLGSLLDEGL